MYHSHWFDIHILFFVIFFVFFYQRACYCHHRKIGISFLIRFWFPITRACSEASWDWNIHERIDVVTGKQGVSFFLSSKLFWILMNVGKLSAFENRMNKIVWIFFFFCLFFWLIKCSIYASKANDLPTKFGC